MRTKARFVQWFAAMLLSTALVVAAPSLAWAAEEAAPHAAGHSEAAHESESSLFAGDLGNVVWTLIIFFTLLVVLRATAWRPILTALQRREQFIADSLDAARRERAESERLLKQYTEQMNKSRDEAAAIVEEGRRDAEAARKRIHEESRAEASATLERAKREIAIARDDAVKTIFAQSIDLGTQIAGRIVKKQLTAQDQQSLLDDALAEMGNLRP